ncbi:MAG TPA: ROK family transcriptional regulator [Verrucomicrobiaceae bacterium]
MLGLKVHDNADFGAEIIRRVRAHEGLSRVELARVLSVAASTIGRHVDALVGAGYFTETLEPTKEAGRPPTRLRPNPSRGCFLGLDFHAERVFATAVDFAQNELLRMDRPLGGSGGTEAVIEELKTLLREMMDQAKLPVLAAGIAAPGRVDNRRGVVTHYAHIPGFDNVPLAQRLGPVVNAPVFVNNNIRTMALAERWFGEGRACQDLICLGVRIGVNAAVVLDGNLATGHGGLGGEIRGWNCPVYDAATEKWTWDAGFTIEKHASAPAAVARFSELRGKPATLHEFLGAARNGDEKAILALRGVAAIHGWTISQMVQIVDPELVVLAGPLTTLGQTYLDSVTRIAHQFDSNYHPSVPILISELGEQSGSIGATALALERWRPADMG